MVGVRKGSDKKRGLIDISKYQYNNFLKSEKGLVNSWPIYVESCAAQIWKTLYFVYSFKIERVENIKIKYLKF